MILIILLGVFAVAVLSDLISLPMPGHVPGQAFAMLVSEMLKSYRKNRRMIEVKKRYERRKEDSVTREAK